MSFGDLPNLVSLLSSLSGPSLSSSGKGEVDEGCVLRLFFGSGLSLN